MDMRNLTGDPHAAVAMISGVAPGAAIAFTLLQLVVAAAVYVWCALALTAVFAKIDEPAWKAWTPVVNLWTLFETAGMRGWWALVQVGGGILVTVVSSLSTAALVGAAQQAAFGGRSDGAVGALLGATVVPTLLTLAYAAAVLVLQVRMMIPLNRGFGLGRGHVALGALLLPVWASVVGWGAPRWRGLPQTSIPPTPFAETPRPRAADPAAAVAFAPPAPTTDTGGWAPPATLDAPAAPADPTEGDLPDHTVLAAHRRPRAAVLLPAGDRVELVSDTAVLGRNPTAPATAPDAQPIAVDDETRTVSKTHALLRRDGDGWTVADLSSTNGVVVGDDEVPVGTAVPVTGRFLLGDAELTLEPGRP